MNTLNDNEQDSFLWKSYKQGDRESFGKIFRRYYPTLYKYGSKLAANHDLVEECIQELFIDLWQHKKDVEVISIKAYLIKALKYKLFRAIKKSRVSSTEISHETGFEFSHECTIIATEEKDAQQRKMVHALNQLSARQKEIIYLKYYQDLNYEEVSEVMNINYQAARNLLYQSVKALKQLLTGFSLFILSQS